MKEIYFEEGGGSDGFAQLSASVYAISRLIDFSEGPSAGQKYGQMSEMLRFV